MEITNNLNTVSIVGNVKSVKDFQDIKTILDSIVGTQSSIVIELKDSISITSSVIGYFNKLILKDKVNLRLVVGNKQLMALLHDLNLVEIFNARKM